MVIAIDGPSGSGKSTVARILAERLGFRYVDTGAMYRALAWALLRKEISSDQDTFLPEYLDDIKISFDGQGDVQVNGESVQSLIRSDSISRAASDFSKLSAVRRYLVGLQREMGRAGDVVMEGRDIGTRVFPEADLKFFLTARMQIRGERRFKELAMKDATACRDRIMDEMRFRDRQDSERDDSPLVRARDAIEIDTSDMSIGQVVDTLLSHIPAERRPGNKPG
jgi:cytidylate kinase